MTLEEKVNKFKQWQDVYIVENDDIRFGSYVGYCGNVDLYAVDFYQDTDDECVEYFDVCDVFAKLTDARQEQARRTIKQLENQINAIKKEYNL